MRPNTRLVIVSHVLWNTGQLLPLAEISAVCHNYQGNKPVGVLVDAAQSVGMLPLNLPQLGADFYAFTGHKWLCGPVGVGGLYVKKEVMESIQPTFIGWRGVNMGERGEPMGWKEDARRFEVGTSAYPMYEGLQGAIATHHQWGTATKRYERICTLSTYLWQGLREIDGVKCLKDSPPGNWFGFFSNYKKYISPRDGSVSGKTRLFLCVLLQTQIAFVLAFIILLYLRKSIS